MAKIRVLIADDHAIVREGIRMILLQQPDIEVIGEAADGQQAIDQVNRLGPDIVLMDIAMPGLGGLEATIEIRKTRPQTRILVLTQYDDKEYVFRFLKAGASGYVLKKTVGGVLVAAVRSVYEGKSFIDSAVAGTVIEGMLHPEEPAPGEATYESLSDREKQVLKLIAEGYTSARIAGVLNISIKTVMTHRTNLMDKLGLHNRADLVRFAVRHGLIRVE